MNIRSLKERVFKAIDEISDEIRRTPKLRFKEVRTSSLVSRYE